MHMFHDEDEWETVTTYRPCSACGGDLKKCDGRCNGMAGIGQRRRAPEEVSRIKTERRSAHEAAVLAEAASIMARRGG